MIYASNSQKPVTRRSDEWIAGQKTTAEKTSTTEIPLTFVFRGCGFEVWETFLDLISDIILALVFCPKIICKQPYSQKLNQIIRRGLLASICLREFLDLLYKTCRMMLLMVPGNCIVLLMLYGLRQSTLYNYLQVKISP